MQLETWTHLLQTQKGVLRRSATSASSKIGNCISQCAADVFAALLAAQLAEYAAGADAEADDDAAEVRYNSSRPLGPANRSITAGCFLALNKHCTLVTLFFLSRTLCLTVERYPCKELLKSACLSVHIAASIAVSFSCEKHYNTMIHE
jgi:hypothetical protein